MKYGLLHLGNKIAEAAEGRSNVLFSYIHTRPVVNQKNYLVIDNATGQPVGESKKAAA